MVDVETNNNQIENINQVHKSYRNSLWLIIYYCKGSKNQPFSTFRLGYINYLKLSTHIITLQTPTTNETNKVKRPNHCIIRDQNIIYRLETNYNGQKHHMFEIFRIGGTNQCFCGNANQTITIIPQSYLPYKS